jgi:hypothetical protein
MILVVVLVVSLGACGSHSVTTGQLTGTLDYIGGPPGTKETPVPEGAVVVSAVGAQHDDYRLVTDERGRFSLRLPVGRYVVTGGPKGGKPWCFGDGRHPITIGFHADHIEILCPII